jgi:hypothetical protein
MFQNSALSVLQTEPESHTDTTRRGENAQVEEKATDSDQEEDTINEGEADDKDGDIDESDNGEAKAFEHIVKTMNHLPDNHYVWGYPDPTNTYYGADKIATEMETNKEWTSYTGVIANYILWQSLRQYKC